MTTGATSTTASTSTALAGYQCPWGLSESSPGAPRVNAQAEPGKRSVVRRGARSGVGDDLSDESGELSGNYPVVSAPMALVAGGELAAAVTAAGGLGLIGNITSHAERILKQPNSFTADG